MELYNIEPKEFQILERVVIGNSIRYELEPIDRPKQCPQCKDNNIISHSKTKRKARDLNEFNHMVGIVINGHRYKCKTCGKTFTEQYFSIDDNAKMTTRMRDYIREQALLKPFSHTAKELDISVPTIERIFADYVAEMESKRQLIAPRVLGMDETMLNGVYRGMFVDVEARRIIDMTEDRKLHTVRYWLNRLPQKERVECATIDMWGSYKTAIQMELPNVFIVVDKFHVIKHLNEALDIIRKKCASELPDKERKHIKGNRWLLLSNSESLDFMSQCRLHDLLFSYPVFAKPHELKEQFREIYLAETRQEAEALFDKWKQDCQGYPQFEAFADMVENWRTEIFNYFDNRFTNAITESLNRVSKEISAQGRGYNFKVLRAKILYRNTAVKQAKYSYHKQSIEPHELKDLIDIEFTSPEVMTVRANAYAISSGVDIDELSELLKTHHQAIFERAWEQMMNVDPNPDLSDFLDDIEFLGENNHGEEN